jgi:mitochondrial distribution and morphology protein 34
MKEWLLISILHFYPQPPDLEILEIGDLAEERFRGIFRLFYAGDGSVTLLTKVQVCDQFSNTSCALC